ncbi:MAG TPA: FAD-dependent oxidoreductase, partial [Nannocystis sp.]
SDAVFELDAIPARVLVVGAGPIGLELGQALSRLGAAVTILGRNGRVAGLRDPAVAAAARAALAEEVELHARAELEAVRAREDGVWARFRGPDGELHEGTWSIVLAAAGRQPRLSALDPAQAGLELDADGGPRGLDPATLQWGQAPVFVAGDAAGLRPLLHEAIDEGQIAGHNAALFPQVAPGQRRTPLAITFTSPQIAAVGARFDALDPKTCAIGQVDFGDQGRARVIGQNRGLLRVYAARASGLLLGAEMVGPAAEHLGHLLAWAIQQGTTVERALQLPFYHPVIEEGLRTALQQARRNVAQGTG